MTKKVAKVWSASHVQCTPVIAHALHMQSQVYHAVTTVNFNFLIKKNFVGDNVT